MRIFFAEVFFFASKIFQMERFIKIFIKIVTPFLFVTYATHKRLHGRNCKKNQKITVFRLFFAFRPVTSEVLEIWLHVQQQICSQ